MNGIDSFVGMGIVFGISGYWYCWLFVWFIDCMMLVKNLMCVVGLLRDIMMFIVVLFWMWLNIVICFSVVVFMLVVVLVVFVI